MHWLQIDCVTRAPEALEEAFWAAGALAVTLQDAADQPILEPAPGTTPLWPELRLTGLFTQDSEPRLIRQRIAVALGGTPPLLRTQLLEDRVWVREWLKHFRPTCFGRRLWIVPAEAALSAAQSTHEAIVLRLDPGLAFGTGAHPTTALCLEWLDGAELTAQRVLDYGCGSGVLAIAALLLGAAAADALDLDPQALQATAANARANQVREKLKLVDAGELQEQHYDLVLANILSGPLLQLAPALCRCLRVGGQLVLSGLLESQAAEVRAAYEPQIHWEPAATQAGWVRLSGRRYA